MKLLLLLFASMLPIKVMAATLTSELTLTMVGFESDDGYAMVALANSRDTFDARGDGPKPYKNARLKIKNGLAKHVFESLPHGEYAIKVFHDENSNQILDTGFLGIPKESFGFSNNASGTIGPPDYDDARFVLKSEKHKIHIEMQK